MGSTERRSHLFTAAGAVALAACSLIVDSNADPCKTDGDCPIPGSTCGPDRICVAPAVDAGSPTDTGGAADVADSASCSDDKCCTAAQCMSLHGGEPFACPRPGQACVPLKTPACQRLVGNYNDPNAIVFGILSRLSDDSVSTSQQQIDVLELAIGEVNKVTLGIPGATGTPARPLVGVSCDELVEGGPNHLLDELHVPAVIAMGTSGFTVGLTPRLVATDTYFMCPICGSPAVTALDDHNLVWRTQPVAADLGRAQAAYLTELETNVRAAHGLNTSGAATKVAVITNNAFNYSAITENFVANAKYNGGKTPLANGGNFFRIDYADPSVTPTVDLAPVTSQIVAFAPDIIMLSGYIELPDTIMPAIEAGWGSAPKPFYLAHSGIESPDINTYIAAHPAIASRFRLFDFATPAEGRAAFDSYAGRLNTAYPTNDPAGNSNVYDGTYAAIYAIAGVDPTLTLTGSLIAQQMPRLGPPATTKIPVGPTDLPNGASLLRKGGGIDLVGVFTDMNFDANGDVHGDSALFCIAPVSTPLDAGTPTYALRQTQRLFASATGLLSGVDDCP